MRGPRLDHDAAEFSRQLVTEVHIKDHRIQRADTATLASNLKGISGAVAKAPNPDPARVEAVKDSLARGVYEINRERIADKLLQMDAAARSRARRG